MSQDLEANLIQQAKAGSRKAWNLLLERHVATLHGHVRRRWSQSRGAHLSGDDILQETLLQAWLQIETLRGTSTNAFVAWLKAVADLRMLDLLKAQKRLKRGGAMRRAPQAVATDDESWNNVLDQLPDDAKTASSVLNQRERILAVRAAVAVLPTEQQTAVQIHCLEGNTIDQTARQMDRSPAAIRGLLHRGKEKLATDLAKATSWLSNR